VVLSCADAGGDEQKTRAALAELCKIYWRPVFAFICRRGHSVPDAQDLTQDFFVMVLKGHLLERADRSRGRFRSLVLKALQDFLHDAADRRGARKRGGDVQFVSWDDWMAEAPSQLSIPAQESKNWSAERIFDVRWAATIVERALRRLGDECEKRGRRRVFDMLSSCLAAEREDVSYAKFSKTLGVAEVAVKRLVHRLRERYRELLREEVAQTVEKPDDIDDELRYQRIETHMAVTVVGGFWMAAFSHTRLHCARASKRTGVSALSMHRPTHNLNTLARPLKSIQTDKAMLFYANGGPAFPINLVERVPSGTGESRASIENLKLIAAAF
jgi:RNA polymerase sigma factor (sigma-70 family)